MHDMLLDYPVPICTADHLKVQRGRIVISNTDTGEHWVTFYFLKRGPYELFCLIGTHARRVRGCIWENPKQKMPQKCGTTTTIYVKRVRFYCYYYVLNWHAGKPMKEILKDFNRTRKRNDHFLVSKMRPGQKTGYQSSVFLLITLILNYLNMNMYQL